MARMYQGHPQPPGHPGSHIARIGVVTVNQIRRAAHRAQVAQDFIGKDIEMGPKHLLAQVATRPGRQPNNLRFGAEGFNGLGIVGAHFRVLDATSDEIDPINFWTLGERSRQLHHVLGLTTRISIAAQFQIAAPQQAVNANGDDIQVFQVSHGSVGILHEQPVLQRWVMTNDPRDAESSLE